MTTRAKTNKTTAKPARRKSTKKRSTRRDAIAILKADHREVKKLFRDFDRAGDRAYATKGKLADRIVRELSIHAAIEEQVLYPWLRANLTDVDADVLEALEEHHVAKWLLSEIEGLDERDERFVAKVTVLAESVRHHVQEEEEGLFVDLRAQASRADLLELGDALAAAKENAPTRPHPRSADEPPANLIGGPVNAALDHARAVGEETVEALGALSPIG